MKPEGGNGRPAVRALASTISGSWYPGTAAALDVLIASGLKQVDDTPRRMPTPNVLVLPHAGYAYSARTAAYGIRAILGAPFKRVLILAPSHRAVLTNQIVAPESDAVSTPYGVVPVDRHFIETVARGARVVCSDAVQAGEHSTQIQYPMLQYALKDFSIVPFIVGELDAASRARTAAAIRSVLDADTLLVVSTDFTHFGRDFDYVPFAADARACVERIDREAFARIREQSAEQFLAYLDETQATICGRNPLALMLTLLPPHAGLECLHYETSSDGSGDFSRFVCYLCAAGHADWRGAGARPDDGELSADDKRRLLQFARRSIRQTLDRRKACDADAFADEATPRLRQPAGCFVTLSMKATHELRGCIGEIVARRPLYQAVTALAVQAAFGDPRFPELRPAEFDRITIEISFLTPERPVASWREIEIGRHGMTLARHGRSAVFLPQVAPEQGWTLEETLTHLALKAGLRADAWREGASFTVFEAIVFGEREFGISP